MNNLMMRAFNRRQRLKDKPAETEKMAYGGMAGDDERKREGGQGAKADPWGGDTQMANRPGREFMGAQGDKNPGNRGTGRVEAWDRPELGDDRRQRAMNMMQNARAGAPMGGNRPPLPNMGQGRGMPSVIPPSGTAVTGGGGPQMRGPMQMGGYAHGGIVDILMAKRKGARPEGEESIDNFDVAEHENNDFLSDEQDTPGFKQDVQDPEGEQKERRANILKALVRAAR